jgi:hypothetical protein
MSTTLFVRQRRITFWRSVCGCQLAALAFLATAAWQLGVVLSWSSFDGRGVARGLGLALLAAVVAKLAALALARVALVIETVVPAAPEEGDTP